ncbi:MAG: glycosyltransferase family 4 protein [Promethearchaeia archaeon]
MKILIISTSPPEYLGGLAHFTKNLIKKLAENNINIDFLCSSLDKKNSSHKKLYKNVRIIRKKCYLFPNNDNLLKLKYPIFNVLSYLLKYGKNYDLIHVHSYIYFSTIQTFIYKLLFNRKIPIILHLHGGIQTSEFQSTSKTEKILLLIKRYFFDLIIGKILINKANAIISVSKEDLLKINTVFKSKRKKFNYYLPNAIDTSLFKKNENIKRKFIGFIGRLTKIKGIDYFLEIIEKYHKIDKSQEYLIIGEGPYLPLVEKAIISYPIKYYRQIPHDLIPKYYNECKIFLLTSRAEGLPTTILEALACEVPVIASNIGGVAEIIKNGENGYLFDIKDINQIIDKILLIRQQNNYEFLGKNGRKLVEREYSWDSLVKKIILIYNKVLKSLKKF